MVDNCDKFNQKCINRPKRKILKKKITKNVLLTFANKGKCSMLRSDNKTRPGEIILDLFESILFLALQHRIDMEEVLAYPLTLTQLSLFQGKV